MSHFSFTRNLYDECALEQKNQEATGQFRWVTDNSIAESKNSCFESNAPFMHNTFHSIPGESIDIESNLRGQNFKNSRCTTHKFNPANEKKHDTKLKECVSKFIIPDYTRTNRSCNVLSEVSINYFNPLYENVQNLEKIHDNKYIGLNTRLEVKDAFKK